jgi:hypothetical protein
MRLVSKVAAAIAGALRVPFQAVPENDDEEAAWEAYRSGWEMDPPPDPRSVFLAGYRAGQARRSEPG